MLTNIFCGFLLSTFLLTVVNSQSCNSSPSPTLFSHLNPSTLSSFSTAIFPLGSIESHGPHLPLGVDLLLSQSLSIRASFSLPNVTLLPASPFGASFEHASFPGTLPISDIPLNSLWGEVLAGLASAGISKVILVNGHGGQAANAELVARRLRFEKRMLIVVVNVQSLLMDVWKEIETNKELKEFEETYGIHGGLIETSIMMYLYPNLVSDEKRGTWAGTWNRNSTLLPVGGTVSYGWKAEDLTSSGAMGNALEASAAVGEGVFLKCVEEVKKIVIEVRDTELKDFIRVST